jgi:hypothetical protein
MDHVPYGLRAWLVCLFALRKKRYAFYLRLTFCIGIAFLAASILVLLLQVTGVLSAIHANILPWWVLAGAGFWLVVDSLFLFANFYTYDQDAHSYLPLLDGDDFFLHVRRDSE